VTDQTGTFNAQYLDTLELYKKEFSIDPPEDIWSQPKFDKEAVQVNGYESKKKEETNKRKNDYSGDAGLYTYFDFSDNREYMEDYPEFDNSEAGDGTSGSWNSGNTDSSDSDSGTSCSSSCCSSCGGD
jgi:hypothetical protein